MSPKMEKRCKQSVFDWFKHYIKQYNKYPTRDEVQYRKSQWYRKHGCGKRNNKKKAKSIKSKLRKNSLKQEGYTHFRKQGEPKRPIIFYGHNTCK